MAGQKVFFHVTAIILCVGGKVDFNNVTFWDSREYSLILPSQINLTSWQSFVNALKFQRPGNTCASLLHHLHPHWAVKIKDLAPLAKKFETEKWSTTRSPQKNPRLKTYASLQPPTHKWPQQTLVSNVLQRLTVVPASQTVTTRVSRFLKK